MKNLEDKMSAMTIIHKIGMSTKPEFFSGRGARSSDLNDEKLEKIYQIIEREHGKDAAENYVKMVAGIPKLSATDFLITLYTLEGNNWKWDEKLLSNNNGLYASSGTDAYATVVNTLAGDDLRDETDYIRNEFLRRHGIKLKENSREISCYDYC